MNRRRRYNEVLTQSLLWKEVKSQSEYRRTQNQVEFPWANFARSQVCPSPLYQTPGQHAQLPFPFFSPGQVTDVKYFLLFSPIAVLKNIVDRKEKQPQLQNPLP